MKCDGDNAWRPDLEVLQNGCGNVRDAAERLHPIRWAFRRFTIPFFPLTVVECRMTGFGRTEFGFGDSILYKNSVVQAFAEAWERICAFTHPGSFRAENSSRRNSNGCASGISQSDASRRARGELLERALVLQAWEQRRGWKTMRPACAESRLLSFFLRANGWEARIYEIADGSDGRAVCLVAEHEALGTVFDSHYAENPSDACSAQAKVLKSVMRMAAAAADGAPAADDLPEVGSPHDHVLFYRRDGSRRAFDFLRTPEAATPLNFVGLRRFGARQSLCHFQEIVAAKVTK